MAPLHKLSLISKPSPSFFHYAAITPSPSSSTSTRTSSISGISIPNNRLRGCSSCNSFKPSLNFTHVAGFKHMGRSKMGYREMGSDCIRVSAVSGGGVGGNAGGGNSDGGGNSGGSGGESGGNQWSFLSWYLSALEKYPVLTKALTSAILTFIGDLICQLLIDHVSALDLKRTLLFTLLGFVLVGPTLHFWYLSLSKLVSTPGATGAFLRLLLDQFLFSPIFIGFFLSTLLTLEGRPSQIMPKLQQEWLATVVANWQLWIPFQFLNFLFVPQQFQVLAANFIALAWNVILSFKAHKEILSK